MQLPSDIPLLTVIGNRLCDVQKTTIDLLYALINLTDDYRQLRCVFWGFYILIILISLL